MSIKTQLEGIRSSADANALAASVGNADALAKAADAKLAGIWQALLVIGDKLDDIDPTK